MLVYSGWSTGEFYISVDVLLFTMVFSLVYGAILDGLSGIFIFQLMFYCLPWCSVLFMVLFSMSTGEFNISVDVLLFTMVFSLVYGAILDVYRGVLYFS